MALIDRLLGRTPTLRTPSPPTEPVALEPPKPSQDAEASSGSRRVEVGQSGVEVRELGLQHTVTLGGVAVPAFEGASKQLAAIVARPHTDIFDLGTLAFAIERAFPGATRGVPHVGIKAPAPWNFGALLRLSPEEADSVRRALVRYHQPGFVRLPPDEKRAVIAALDPIASDFVRNKLVRFHLPRAAITSTAQPITLAIESETKDLGRIYAYYAPDPTGKLELRAMSDTLKQKLLDRTSNWCKRGRTPMESRTPDDAWLASLRWKDLNPNAQHEYLKGYQAAVDPQVKLHKITDVKHAPAGELAPESLQDTLKWERELKLKVAELITKGSYTSLDAQRADRAWISERFNSGFHLHAVTELSSAEDKRVLGPKLTALAALQDLALFARAAAGSAANFTHVFLEPWTAAFTNEVAASFADGKIDADTILPHKFHLVGMRTGIYGQDDRVGLEIRGVLRHHVEQFDHATVRAVSMLSDGGVANLPSPPWPGWDAGEKDVGKAFEEKARAALATRGPRARVLQTSAKLSFDEVMDVVVRGSGKKNGFSFSAPLWNFEALPGLTDAEKARIGTARRAFTDQLLLMSELVSVHIEQGRDLETLAPHVYEKVITAAMTFFKDAGIDKAVDRVLDDAAKQAIK